MNREMFNRLMADKYNVEKISTLIQNENTLATILTSHLLLEGFLEDWICSHLDIDDLFKKPEKGSGKIEIRMSFTAKAKLAQRLGVDIDTYHIIEELNAIRNDFSHQIFHDGPNEAKIKTLIERCSKLTPKDGTPLNDPTYEIGIYSPDETKRNLIRVNDDDTPVRIKYFAIVSHIMLLQLLKITDI